MSGVRLDDALWLLWSTQGPARLARVTVVLWAALATGATSMAAGEPFVIGSAVIFVAAVGCAIAPDSHLGLALTLGVVAEWALRVEDVDSPWVLLVATSIGCLHISLALAGIAPGGAALDRSIVNRWVVRATVCAGSALAVWGAVRAVGQFDLGQQTGLVGLGFAAAAALTVWLGSASSPRE